MGPSDHISADPDDPAEAQRLRAFFSTASARVTDALPAPPTTDRGDRLPPAGPPLFPTDVDEVVAALNPDAPVDMGHLVAYLDAQLELTRRRSEDGVERVLAALATMDARMAGLETFRDELFEWLESYVGWEAATLARITGQVLEGAEHAEPAEPLVEPEPAPLPSDPLST